MVKASERRRKRDEGRERERKAKGSETEELLATALRQGRNGRERERQTNEISGAVERRKKGRKEGRE